MRRRGLIIFAVASAIMLTGCNDTSQIKRYNSLVETTNMGNGADYVEYESLLKSFIGKMYKPDSLTDMAESSYIIKGITTDEEFEKLIEEFRFIEGEKYQLSGFETTYGRPQYTSDGTRKMIVKYTTSGVSGTERIMFIFYLDSSGRIYEHERWELAPEYVEELQVNAEQEEATEIESTDNGETITDTETTEPSSAGAEGKEEATTSESTPGTAEGTTE